MSEYVTVWVDDLPDLKCGEEIVRCRDCERYRDHMWITVPEFEPLGTDIDDVCTFFAGGVKVSPDGFCAWAERREQ